jgi:nucleoside-diphosphate-sugar epimerase
MTVVCIVIRVGQGRSLDMFTSNRIVDGDMRDILSRRIDWRRFDNKTVAVTGAYGMLASYLVYFLIFLNETKKSNIKVVSLSRSEEKFSKRFGVYATRPYLSNIPADINKPLDIDGKVDFIVHAASLASPQHYETIPREVALPNVLGTYNLLELAVAKRSESFLFFSTGSVYGKTDKAYLDEADFGVVDPLDIHSCYDESKRMGETLCKIYNWQFNTPVKMARFGHTYGPTMDIENDPRVFSEFVGTVVRGGDVEMKSDGSARRSFCYITDATAAAFKLLLDGRDGEAYNVVNTDETYAIRDLADIVAEIGGVSVVRKERTGDYLEAPAAVGIGSNEKLKRLGWECRHDVRSGFARTIDSFKLGSA